MSESLVALQSQIKRMEERKTVTFLVTMEVARFFPNDALAVEMKGSVSLLGLADISISGASVKKLKIEEIKGGC